MFGSILLRIGTYLVETFIGTGAVKDGGIRLENVKNAIETKINDVKKTTEIGNIKNILAEIPEADDKTVRREKVDAIIKQIDEITFAQPNTVGIETVNSFSNNLLKFSSETGVLKLALGFFLVILLFTPYCVKRSLKESGIVQGTRETAAFAVKNLKSFKLSKDSIEFNINNPEEVASAKAKVDAVDKKLKSALANNSSCREENPNCFVYLGEAKSDRSTWANAETIDSKITIGSLTNSKITFTNGAYLRSANTKITCPHGEGEIIGAVLEGQSATIIGEPDFCPINGRSTYGVWVKVRKN